MYQNFPIWASHKNVQYFLHLHYIFFIYYLIFLICFNLFSTLAASYATFQWKVWFFDIWVCCEISYKYAFPVHVIDFCTQLKTQLYMQDTWGYTHSHIETYIHIIDSKTWTLLYMLGYIDHTGFNFKMYSFNSLSKVSYKVISGARFSIRYTAFLRSHEVSNLRGW